MKVALFFSPSHQSLKRVSHWGIGKADFSRYRKPHIIHLHNLNNAGFCLSFVSLKVQIIYIGCLNRSIQNLSLQKNIPQQSTGQKDAHTETHIPMWLYSRKLVRRDSNSERVKDPNVDVFLEEKNNPGMPLLWKGCIKMGETLSSSPLCSVCPFVSSFSHYLSL